jgi:hypothetical protein
MADASGNWDLAFVMPNLQLDSAFEFEGIAFVPADESDFIEK